MLIGKHAPSSSAVHSLVIEPHPPVIEPLSPDTTLMWPYDWLRWRTNVTENQLGQFGAPAGSICSSPSTHPLSYVVPEPTAERSSEKDTILKKVKLWISTPSRDASSVYWQLYFSATFSKLYLLYLSTYLYLWNKCLNKKTNNNCDFILNHKSGSVPWSPFSLQSLAVLFPHCLPPDVP